MLQLRALVEAQNPALRCFIMLLHDDRLHYVAAPQLPASYLRAFDGLVIGPSAGSCGTAAYRNAPVIVADITTDPLWDRYRTAALAHDLRACWSWPIRSATGHVWGTFAVYASAPQQPSDNDLQLLDMASNLAAIAIEQRQLIERMAYQAHHDSLTGLPNRLLLGERLQQALRQAQHTGRAAAVLFVDLDRFKQINDTLGHHIGDRLLQHVAHRLQGYVHKHDTVARMGGDEFTLVLRNLGDPHDAVRIGHRVLAVLQQPFMIDNHELFVTASIGISMYPQDADDSATLQQQADNAMYHAKASGKNGVQCYATAIHATPLQRMEREHQLRWALKRREFELYYQPQVTLDGTIVGLEALLRWRHPRLGMIAPNTFISLAEETGLIVPIVTWVLTTACHQIKAWHDGGVGPISVAVNVSTAQFARRCCRQCSAGAAPKWP